jgi:DNA repair exonuclease SbcCD ATPase subunit
MATTVRDTSEMDALRKQLNSLNSTKTLSSTREVGGNAMLLKRLKEADAEIEELKSQLAAMESSGGGGGGVVSAGKASGGGAKSGGNDSTEVKSLQKRIRELETQLSKGGGGGGDSAAEKKAVAAVEKKYEKQAKELEKVTRKEKAALESRVSQLESDLEQTTARCTEAETERDQLRQRVKELGNANSEMENLRAKAAQVDQLNESIVQFNQQITQLTAQYKKEAQLRKQYKNELEDLKGAIRVYARVRPMAGYEYERGCQKIVEFPDETSVKVHTSRGDKEFEFDAAFTEASTQEQVFEDTRRLVESFLDGFNVCLFAYGQTGSGKVCNYWLETSFCGRLLL